MVDQSTIREYLRLEKPSIVRSSYIRMANAIKMFTLRFVQQPLEVPKPTHLPQPKGKLQVSAADLTKLRGALMPRLKKLANDKKSAGTVKA